MSEDKMMVSIQTFRVHHVGIDDPIPEQMEYIINQNLFAFGKDLDVEIMWIYDSENKSYETIPYAVVYLYVNGSHQRAIDYPTSLGIFAEPRIMFAKVKARLAEGHKII